MTTIRIRDPCVFVTLLLALSDAYKEGTLVPLMKRSVFQQDVGEWVSVLPRFSPRFAEDTFIELDNFDPNDVNAFGYKMAFSFGDHEFFTPWILVMSEERGLLAQVDFLLRHDADSILSMDYVTRYSTLDEPAEHLHINFRWESVDEEDRWLGQLVLLLGGLLSTAFLVASLRESRNTTS
eukprot:CAMPEP_0177680988 /NCGR_PEP_ID=MMETSP0447-20121125/30468_1 /TAXON_ID=0 /ORGANISM="Stygamoeba regulata, Strain BSH-02190019" /LENGTH=179 /DNA_ID=CAMNT_0019190359 /DNA_START=49 /DNA_END=585 /DNA_ORIENTATION=-